MKKQYALLCGSFLGLAILAFTAFFFFADSYTRNQVLFTSYEDLKEKTLSADEYTQYRDAYRSCFGETRRTKLTAFYSEKLNLEASHDKAMVAKRVEEYLQKELLTERDYLESRKNITLITHKSAIIGFYTCNESSDLLDDSTMLWDVCITPKMRGKGIGNLLVEDVIKRCKTPGRSLSLVVYKDNLRAQSLYQKHGFTPEDMPYDLEDSFSYYDKILMVYKKK